MFLSNPRKSFLLLVFFASILQACGGPQTAQNKDISLTGDTKSEFPFSTREPEVYQGDLVTTSGEGQDHYFVARKGDKWRYDIFRGADIAMSQIRSDKLYGIDHRKKTYWEIPEQRAAGGDINDITRNFFRGHEYHNFDEIGRDGTLIKYKVRDAGDSKGDVIITIDTASGVIVKHEFMSRVKQQPDFVYEVRNLKMEVDDSVFVLPAGYQKVAPPK